MYTTLMFEYDEIEKVVREKFDPTFDLSILLGQYYSNDCAVPYHIGLYYQEEYNEEIHYNNIAYNIIDEYMIFKGATKGQEVWIDITW